MSNCYSRGLNAAELQLTWQHINELSDLHGVGLRCSLGDFAGDAADGGARLAGRLVEPGERRLDVERCRRVLQQRDLEVLGGLIHDAMPTP